MIMPKWEITIIGDPVAKGRPKLSTRGGFARAYTPAKTVQAEKIIAEAVKKEWKKEPLSTPLIVGIFFVMPFRKSMSKKARLDLRHIKRPDLDNMAKLVCDSLNEILWADDSLIYELHLRKEYGDIGITKIRVEWYDPK